MAKTEKPNMGTSDWYEAAREDEDRRFLSGSREHPEELASAGRVFLEFVRGFQRLGALGRCVTVFGSARFSEEHDYYELARQVGQRLAREAQKYRTGFRSRTDVTRSFT
jgi:hypothetical protein